jgi:hypothetical protein
MRPFVIGHLAFITGSSSVCREGEATSQYTACRERRKLNELAAEHRVTREFG